MTSHADTKNRPCGSPAFEEFFAASWPRAYRTAVLLTQDRDLGEEVAQEAMTHLYEKWDSICSPTAYLRTAIVNASVNRGHRARTQRSKLFLVAEPEVAEPSPGSELTDALARLPYRQRAVMVLRYYGDLSETEIAEALGCRPGTVKSLASRALDRLSKEITP